jgi:hypothetical protein
VGRSGPPKPETRQLGQEHLKTNGCLGVLGFLGLLSALGLQGKFRIVKGSQALLGFLGLLGDAFKSRGPKCLKMSVIGFHFLAQHQAHRSNRTKA